MSAFDDHSPCPALHRWLLSEREGEASAWWSDDASPSRGLRKLLARRSIERLPDGVLPESLDMLVVLSWLPDGPPALGDARWNAIRPGGTLVELASPRRRQPGELLRPWAHARRLRESTSARVRHWLELGAFAPEQWVAVEPSDTVVTMVRRAIRIGST